MLVFTSLHFVYLVQEVCSPFHLSLLTLAKRKAQEAQEKAQEDHLCILCERDKAVARLLCAKVEEFTADLPLADTAMEFMSWKEHKCTWSSDLNGLP